VCVFFGKNVFATSPCDICRVSSDDVCFIAYASFAPKLDLIVTLTDALLLLLLCSSLTHSERVHLIFT
jgi:hypothetical protein